VPDPRKLKIVVVAGGSDPHYLVFEIAKALAIMPESFEVFLFSNSSSTINLDSRFHYLDIGSKLDEVSREADLILTTSSTSSLEFIARGFCVGVACAVDNQRQYYDSLGELGVAAQIGFRMPTLGWNLDPDKIHMLITRPDFRESLTKKAVGLIDFQGASRIVDAITTL
jgi:spore coat polysaccharide biosynthesis predicted glycosyltransferase SpsG